MLKSNCEPIVSVVMSVFNGEKYIREALESVLSQSFENFEFIIIDDGSTDLSLPIIKDYASKDQRIILISRENKGLVFSLNEGISKARGQYIARMDADDICHLDRFQEQVAFLDQNEEIGVCGSWAEVFGDNVKTRVLKHPATTKELKPKLLFSVCFAHPTVMMRRKTLEQFNLSYDKDALHVEDYELWIRLAEKTQLANLQKVLLRYRYVETSVSRTADATDLEQRFYHLKRLYSRALSELKIKNTDEDNWMHFILLSNERLQDYDISLIKLNTYLNKITSHNKQHRAFDDAELTRLLSHKYLVAAYYQVKNSKIKLFQAIRSRFFYLGLKGLLAR